MTPPPLLRSVSAAAISAGQRRPVDARTLAGAGAILEDLRTRGDEAVLEHAIRLGDLRHGESPLRTRAVLDCALDGLPRQSRDVLERIAGRIASFARAQRGALHDLDVPIPGGRAGHTATPVESAGCYAPGGRFPLPSSALMTVIPARTAGVEKVWVCSPRPTTATLAAAAIAGADGLLAIGGVQAVGAMAFGLCGLPRCDVIVGPGNRWVTAAKKIIVGEAGIDMLAGPSELVVLADDSADPVLIAADLLAQAEHDDDAVPILVTSSPALAARVESELLRQLETLPTAPTARRALGNGMFGLASSLDEAIAACDRLAPEHLQIMTRDAQRVASRVRHAGAIFIGPRSAEVLGDYGAGPNHVLPTGGSARSHAGLAVFTFLRVRTWLRIEDPDQAAPLSQDARDCARMEGLEAHARAAELRLST